jgi:hypothetical protein
VYSQNVLPVIMFESSDLILVASAGLRDAFICGICLTNVD